MGFIKQPEGDNKCGAYCIAYWKWININHWDPSEYILDESKKADQEKCVNEIYNHIKFDPSDADDLDLDEEFSDPKKMIDYLRESEGIQQKGTILYNANSVLKDEFGNYYDDYYLNNDSKDKLPDLNVGDFAILILLNDNMRPQHYVLVKKDESGKVKVINPGDGDWDSETWDSVDKVEIPEFINSRAAIYIMK